MSLFTEFDHYNPPVGADGTPNEYYESLRDEAMATDTAIGWSEKYGGYWVCAGYAEAESIFRNVKAFSSVEPNFPAYEVPGKRRVMVASYDDPEHKKYRSLIQTPFSPRSVASMDERFRADANLLIDKFIDAERVDIAKVLAAEVPGRSTAIMLGSPPEAGTDYRAWVLAMAGHERFEDPEGAAAKVAAMHQHFLQLLADRRAKPGDDVMSIVINAEKNGERLSDEELEDFFAVLLFAGIDNTLHFLSVIFWRLAWDIELRRRLRQDPRLIDFAIDEFLRLHNTTMAVRTVTQPVTVGDVDMEPGQMVILDLRLINRDSRQFDHPDAFLLDRTGKHLGFGVGVHRCLGAHQVRLQTRAVLEEALKRFPDWSLDRDAPSRWVGGQVGGFVSVPIVFATQKLSA